VTETFEQYTARLIGLSAGKDPRAVLGSTAARIGALIAGRSAGDLAWSPAAGRWSIAQIVTHLADAEIVSAYRFRMILAAPGTDLQAFDQSVWAREMHYERADAHASLALFAAVRASLLRLVRDLDDERLDRFGLHPERGKESIRHLLNLYAGHDLNHVAQIERLVAERGLSDRPAAGFAPAPVKPAVDQATLDTIDVRVGTIRAVSIVAGADRLALLTVDFGDRTRSIVAGIRTERPSLDELVGV
jgi:tRNA-binding EMAP/Myf-like protein